MERFFLYLKWIIRHFSVDTTGIGRMASPRMGEGGRGGGREREGDGGREGGGEEEEKEIRIKTKRMTKWLNLDPLS